MALVDTDFADSEVEVENAQKYKPENVPQEEALEVNALEKMVE